MELLRTNVFSIEVVESFFEGTNGNLLKSKKQIIKKKFERFFNATNGTLKKTSGI